MHDHSANLLFPTWFRGLVIALGIVVLCSCRAPLASDSAPTSLGRARGPQQRMPAPAPYEMPPQYAMAAPLPMPAAASILPGSRGVTPQYAAQQAAYQETIPGDAYGVPSGPCNGCASGCGPCQNPSGCAGMEGCPPGPWAPPGLACPWPYDEYICDGGDRIPSVAVGPDWKVYGLEDEDTIIHFDQRDGRVEVEATNRVCIYAPRFASVRHVTPLNLYAGRDIAGGLNERTVIEREQEVMAPNRATQRTPAATDLGVKPQTTLAGLDKNAAITRDLLAHEFAGGFKAHEDFTIIRMGTFVQTEKAMLAERIDAAIAWTVDQGMQVIVEGREALVATGDKRAEATYTIDPNPPARLRLVKVASVCDAKPGEIIEFTIRYDNVGASPMGNVTIMDNLTTRLELVPDSAQSSLPAKFSTQRNEFGSLVLRWEIKDPIDPGKGGLVRFKCKVR